MATVAVIGASRDRAKYGNKAVRAYRDAGWTVYPVNPREEEIEGIRAYRSVADVPGEIDRATLYLPPAVGVGVLEEIAAKGVGELWVNPGSGSAELIETARALGIVTVEACSIVAIGKSPGAYW
jgi:hypothetical protein